MTRRLTINDADSFHLDVRLGGKPARLRIYRSRDGKNRWRWLARLSDPNYLRKDLILARTPGAPIPGWSEVWTGTQEEWPTAQTALDAAVAAGVTL